MQSSQQPSKPHSIILFPALQMRQLTGPQEVEVLGCKFTPVIQEFTLWNSMWPYFFCADYSVVQFDVQCEGLDCDWSEYV